MFYRLLAGFIALYAYACLRSWQRVLGVISIMPWWAYMLICMLFLGVFLIGRLWLSIPPRIGRVLNLWGGYWLAFAFYFILITMLFDIASLANALFGIVDVTYRISLASGYAIVAITCIVIMIGAWKARHMEVSEYSISLENNTGDSRIYNVVMVSDIHMGDIYDLKDMEDLVANINKLSPDLIIIAGDIIDNPYTAVALYRENDIGRVFRGLGAPYGVYAVLGNHDSFEEGEITRSFFANTPVRILKDEAVVVDNSFVVIGRQDACVQGRASLEEMIEQNGLPAIVIDHRPIRLEQSSTAGASLLLCGHTHAGQMFPFNMVAKALFDVHYGYAKRGDMHIVVSSGYGTSILPVRLCTKSEIVRIQLMMQA